MVLNEGLAVDAEPGERVAVTFAVEADNRPHVLDIESAGPVTMPDPAPTAAATLRTPYTHLATVALESGPARTERPTAMVPGAIVALISLMGPVVAYGLAAR
jgi:hypothetical protein